MAVPPCQGCRARDARISELEGRLAAMERLRQETAYLRGEAKTDRNLPFRH